MKGMTRTELASEELHHYIRATVWKHADVENEQLEVLTSFIVQPGDECRQPVYNYLAEVCSKEIDWETVKQPDMMFGKARRTEYTIYQSCPGDSTDHNCKYERVERVGVQA